MKHDNEKGFFIKKESENSLCKLSSESLRGLPFSLTQLTIAGFKTMTSIESNTFQHIPGLETLSLRDNSIEYIEPAAFNNLYRLVRLYLQGNVLNYFRLEPCCLKILNLSGNQMKFFPKRSITNLPTSLVNLDLSRNMIVDIESGAFEGLINLRCLKLGLNAFKQLDLSNIINRDTANLRFLDMRGYVKKMIIFRLLSTTE
jgi:Leucine-rich repeat (LRR) protein